MRDHAKTLRDWAGELYLGYASKAAPSEPFLSGAAAIEELAELRAALEWFVANGHVDHGGEGWYVFWMHPQGDGEYDQGPVIDKDLTTALIGAYREATKK